MRSVRDDNEGFGAVVGRNLADSLQCARMFVSNGNADDVLTHVVDAMDVGGEYADPG